MSRGANPRGSVLQPTRSQRRGLLLLACILATHLYFKWYKRHWRPHEVEMSSLEVSRQLEVLSDSISVRFSAQKRGMRESSFKKATKKRHAEEAYFSFDPNTLSDSGWMSMGLSARQVQVIRNYQRAGGEFRKAEDVGKLYTLPEGWFERHRDDIRIAPRKQQQSSIVSSDTMNKRSNERYQKESSYGSAEPHPTLELPLELNAASQDDLEALRGVGEKSAIRILRFREALGGFTDTTQLREVWGLHPEVLKTLLQKIEIDPSRIRKIDLDTASVPTLAAHPYISWKVARSLVRYREQHGRFKKVDDIRASYLVSDSLAERLKPYLHAAGDH